MVFELPSLKNLDLQYNTIVNAHLTVQQLGFLKALSVFAADAIVSGSCGSGYEYEPWGDMKFCVMTNTLGSSSQSGENTGGSSSGSSSIIFIILGGLVGVALGAVAAGVLFFNRAKHSATDRLDSTAFNVKQKASAAMKMRKLFKSKSSNDLDTAFHASTDDSIMRKATFNEIPSSEVHVLQLVATSTTTSTSLGQYANKLVYVTRLQIAGDAAGNCEAALEVLPVVSQLRHPQLLSVLGLIWEDGQSISALCEYMNLGTLEDYLRNSKRKLTWKNFKLSAAAQIGACLMYLHSQRNLTYEGLNGRSVFVDTAKGCKLNTLQASVPSDMFAQSPARAGLSFVHGDTAARGFLAPEILAGEQPRPSSDMYAFGVLLAQLDTGDTADEMIRSSWRMRSGDLDDAAYYTSASNEDGSTSTSMLSMFPFTDECPPTVMDLACACLQFDPSLRPSASYVVAMLRQQR